MNTVPTSPLPESASAAPDYGQERAPIVTLLCNLLWIPPALLLLGFIWKYSTDVPSVDQWDAELPFLQKVSEGTATFKDLVAQYNEHRIATNRIVGWLFAAFTNWNTRWELVVSWLLACVCAWSFAVLGRQSLPGRPWRLFWPFLLSSLFLFSLPPYACWLNAVCMQWFIVQAFIATGLVVAGSNWKPRIAFPVCMVLAVLSTYSISTGMAAWLVLLPALVLSPKRDEFRRKIPWIAAWIIVAGLCIGCYFWDYQKPADSPPLVGLKNPSVLLQFFVATVGSPFALGTALSPVALAYVFGSIILTLYLLALAYAWWWRTDQKLLRRMLPWLMVGAYALITGLGISLGRSGYPVEDQALSSRFMNTHVLTVIALIFLFPVISEHASARPASPAEDGVLQRDRRLRLRWNPMIASSLGASLMTAATFILLCHSVEILRAWEEMRITTLTGKAALMFVRYFTEDAIFKPLYHKTTEQMLPKAEFMHAAGYLRPGLVQSTRINDLLGSDEQGLGTQGNYGALERGGNSSENMVTLSGWAVFPGRHSLSDAVILTWESGGSEPTVFAVAEMGVARKDVAAALGGERYRRAGWFKIFKVEQAPRSAVTFRAWAFDTDSAKAFPLTGEFTLNSK